VNVAKVDEALEAERIAQAEAESDARADAEAGQAPVDVAAPIVVPSLSPVVSQAVTGNAPPRAGSIADGELRRAVLSKIGRLGLSRDQAALQCGVGIHTLFNFFADSQPIGPHTRARLRAWVSLVDAPVPKVDQHWPTARAQAIEKPFGLTPSTTPLEKPMSKTVDQSLGKQLAAVLEKIGRGAITKAAAAIGCSHPTVRVWSNDGVPEESADQVRAFISTSLGVGDNAPEPKQRKPRAMKSTGGGSAVRPDAPASTDLLSRAADLARNLSGVGAADGAEIVTQLVDRLRQVRTACTF
jgi:hypothetical protein